MSAQPTLSKSPSCSSPEFVVGTYHFRRRAVLEFVVAASCGFVWYCFQNRYLFATAAFLGCRVARRFIRTFLRAFAAVTTNDMDDKVLELVIAELDGFTYLVYAAYCAVFFTYSFEQEPLPKFMTGVPLKVLLLTLATWRVLAFVRGVFGLALASLSTSGDERMKHHASWLKSALKVAEIALCFVGVIFVADNCGLNVSSLTTGLGVSGLTIALSSQALLQDFAAFIALCLDAPFVVGDSIHVGTQHGTVESIGLKTTKVRGLDGELQIYANKDISAKTVNNYSSMPFRRCALNIELGPHTTKEQMLCLPDLLKEAIQSEESCAFHVAAVRGVTDRGISTLFAYKMRGLTKLESLNCEHRVLINLIEGIRSKGIELLNERAVPWPPNNATTANKGK